MRYHLSRLAAGAAAALAVTVAAAGASTSPAAASVASPQTAAAALPAVAPPRTVVLVNGDSESVPAAGAGLKLSTMTAPGKGISGSVLTLGLGRRTYQIPAVALPYLGHGLSPSLFNVSALLGAESAGKLPVQVSYSGSVPSLPGVTITKSANGIATGYLTAQSASRFGAALARQYLADHSRGSYGQDGLFADRVTIRLAGTGPDQTAARNAPRAGYTMKTLTVHGTDLAGHADTGGTVAVFNADDSSLFGDPLEAVSEFYHGTAKFSVPAGHYWAFGDFVDQSKSGTARAERLVVLPQLTVRHDSSARVSERAASSKIEMITPRPSVVEGTEFELRRPAAAGRTVSAAWLESGAFPLWVSPTRKPPGVGGLQAFTDQWRVSPGGAPRRYEYDLAYQALRGVIPAQRYLVRPGGLATINMRYYSDQPTSAGWAHPYGAFRAQLNDYLSGPNIPVPMPSTVTDYVTGNPSILWSNYIFRTWVSRADNSGFEDDALHELHAGERVTENWNAYPLHPAVDVNLLGKAGLPRGAISLFRTVPSANRSGDTLRLLVNPFSDSQPGHRGTGLNPESGVTLTGSYEVDENGKKVAGGTTLPSATGFGTSVRLTPKPSVIRFRLNVARSGADYPLSTASSTTWTWRSRHASGVTLPPDWACRSWLDPRPASRDCRVEPMMTLGYHVAGMALDGTAPAGRQDLRVTAGHLQLARAAKITSAHAQVSFDDGLSWQAARVSGRAGRYTATYSAPPGSQVTLRVSAADAAGGRIAETITRAYQVAS